MSDLIQTKEGEIERERDREGERASVTNKRFRHHTVRTGVEERKRSREREKKVMRLVVMNDPKLNFGVG